MHYDVFRNPVTRAPRMFPYVAVLQADAAGTGTDRFVAPLTQRSTAPGLVGRFCPVIPMDGESVVLVVPALTRPPVNDLRAPLGFIADRHHAVTVALDFLFQGI